MCSREGVLDSNPTTPELFPKVFVARRRLLRNAPSKGHHSRYITLFFKGTYSVILSPRKLHPLLEEKDLKNDRPNNYFFWTFATHMAQMPPKKYNFTQFAAFFHFLLIKINYYFV